MGELTVLPTWAVWLVSLGGPVGAALGVVLTTWVSRRNADETEQRSLREETMRTLRWAAELAVSADVARAALGVAELRALSQSEMNDDEQQAFVDAALQRAVASPRSAIEAADAAGVEAEVLLDPSPGVATNASAAKPPEPETPGVDLPVDERKETPGGEEDRGGDERPAGGRQSAG